jgi:hypothetical protein
VPIGLYTGVPDSFSPFSLVFSFGIAVRFGRMLSFDRFEETEVTSPSPRTADSAGRTTYESLDQAFQVL